MPHHSSLIGRVVSNPELWAFPTLLPKVTCYAMGGLSWVPEGPFTPATTTSIIFVQNLYKGYSYFVKDSLCKGSFFLQTYLRYWQHIEEVHLDLYLTDTL